MRYTLTLVLTLAFIGGSGCATIVQGTTEQITVNSEPPGARVIVNGQDMGVTPTTLTLKRGRDHQLVFQKEGYQNASFNVEKEMDTMPFIVGNLFSWGVVGWVMDAVNGAAYELSPDHVNVTLQAEE